MSQTQRQRPRHHPRGRPGVQPTKRGVIQPTHFHGLGDEIVHASCGARLPIVVERVGRQCQDGACAPTRQDPNQTRRLKAAHLGHLHVHQHEVVGVRSGQTHGLAAVGRGVHVQADAVQHGQCDLEVDLVVLDQQDSRTAVALAELHLGIGHVNQLRRRHHTMTAQQAGGEPEGAANARCRHPANRGCTRLLHRATRFARATHKRGSVLLDSHC